MHGRAYALSVTAGTQLGGLTRRLQRRTGCLVQLARYRGDAQMVQRSLPHLQAAQGTRVRLSTSFFKMAGISPMDDTQLIMDYAPRSDADRILADTLAEVTRKEHEEARYAYAGYTTPRLQAAKRRVMQPAAMEDESDSTEMHECIAILSDELAAMLPYVGQRRAKPPSAARVLRHRWEQRQAELRDRSVAFRVAPVAIMPHDIRVGPDGQESLARYCPNTAVADDDEHGQGGTCGSIDADCSTAKRAEHSVAQSLPPPDYAVVTCHDVNHVRYLLSLAYRRVRNVSAAERMLYDILISDVANVDALECLLELYLGLDDTTKVRQLLQYLDSRDEAARRPTLMLQAHSDKRDEKHASDECETDVCGESDALAALLAEDASPRPVTSGAEAAATSVPVSNVASLEVALQLLVDLLLDSVARRCAMDGEGTAARDALANITLLLRELHEAHSKRFIELLLSGLADRHALLQHRVRRVVHKDAEILPGRTHAGDEATQLSIGDAEMLLSSTITAVLKALLVPHIARATGEPARFRSVVLHYLNAVQHDVRCLPSSTSAKPSARTTAALDTYTFINEPPPNTLACNDRPQD